MGERKTGAMQTAGCMGVDLSVGAFALVTLVYVLPASSETYCLEVSAYVYVYIYIYIYIHTYIPGNHPDE